MAADVSGGNSDWDSRCKQCGSCCFEKIEDERGNIFYMQSACRFLDVASRRCKIFERRFEINPSCIQLTPELVPTLRWLPRNCGYNLTVEEPAKATRKTRK
ncbi:MAG: YkgJ family cysteine cluster protein [Desulfuromonadaceae bacterium]